MTQNEMFKKLRKSLNLTQIEMANKIGVLQGTITDIERGRIGVSKRVAKKLNQAFGTEIGELFGRNVVKNTEKTYPENVPSNVPLPDFFETDVLSALSYDNQQLKDILMKELNTIENDLSQNILIYLLDSNRYLKLHLAAPENRTSIEKELEESKAKIVEQLAYLRGVDISMESNTGLLLRLKHIASLREATRLLVKGILEASRELYLNSINDKG